jgi:hypothetical protein
MSVICPPTTEDRHALPETFRWQYDGPPPRTLEFAEGDGPDFPNPVKPTLVIGDVHGHFDRLEALLLQEGILGECPDCGGGGDHAWDGDMMCPPCGGDGSRRINFDVEVVQIGDLGHFGQDASPTGDMMCWKYAADWFDAVLWGNHDRAVIDGYHVFSGYLSPGPEIKHYMHGLYARDKLKLAHVAHGWLLTHAGLQAGWKQQKGIDFDRDDPDAFVKWINEKDWWPGEREISRESHAAVRDAISRNRGGGSPTGGILWRDDRKEKLYRGMKQVFGHTASLDGHFFYQQDGDRDRVKVETTDTLPGDTVGINLDIGSKYGQHLGGVWLPDLRLVRVDL